MAGRCLYVALRDEAISDLAALNRALEPYLTNLFRLAARGHWVREQRPMRSSRDRSGLVGAVTPVAQAGIKLSGTISTEGEVALLLSLESKNVMYPLGNFAEIREFATMLERLKPGETWNGVHYHAYTVADGGADSTQFIFYRHRDGVALGFVMNEWQHLRVLLAAVLNSPRLRPFWDELELVYGEL